MKVVKIVVGVALAYVALVVVFESVLGLVQPRLGSTLVITTFDADGGAHDRVVARLESDGHLYVAANHWPRAWYRRALASPEVEATLGGEKHDYHAVEVTGAERDRVAAANPLPLGFRILTGFPPRRFLRLDPFD